MVAYSSIGHMGYVQLPPPPRPLSLLASVFQMISHGLISALLFLLVGALPKDGYGLDILRAIEPERGLP